MKRLLFPLACIFITLTLNSQVIAPSNPRTATHTLSSGDVTIGISSAGGGYLNMIDLPGKGDIMDVATDMYGRGGQSAMRDRLRSGKYNPTQAGFNETIGTPSQILQSDDSLVIVARQCALWHGDGGYDYIRWENIGADPYKNDNGNSDIDGIEEESLEGKQLTEVGSEFDYYCVYENYMGRDSISIPCFRHYYEYRFIREPGHCLSQFAPGTPVYNSNYLVSDISNVFPDGSHPAGEHDISSLIKVWSLRNDISKWYPRYRHLVRYDGELIVQERTGDLAGGGVLGSGAAYQPLVIIADSADGSKGLALGLYRPESIINTHVTAGVDESNGEIMYEDDRSLVVRILEQPQRVGTMSKYGFYLNATGLLNRQRCESGIYEMVRSEFYMLVGTPAEIIDAAQKIHPFTLREAQGSEWPFDSDLEGWVLFKSLSGEVNEGILDLEITGGDPYMISPSNLSVDATTLNQVVVKMRNGTNTSSGRIYWTTNTAGNFNATNSQSFNLVPNDTEIRTYTIDMSDHSGWSGTITGLRLDPSNEANSGPVDIDYIGILENEVSNVHEQQISSLFSIYPVPAGDHFTVDHSEPALISVFDARGSLMQELFSEAGSCRVETSTWGPGPYMVRVKTAEETRYQKIIVQ